MDTETVKVGNPEIVVTIKMLTVGQIQSVVAREERVAKQADRHKNPVTDDDKRKATKWMKDRVAEFDVVATYLLADGLTFEDLFLMCDLTKESIKNLTPPEVETVVSKCQEVNSSFFEMRRKYEMATLAALQAS